MSDTNGGLSRTLGWIFGGLTLALAAAALTVAVIALARTDSGGEVAQHSHGLIEHSHPVAQHDHGDAGRGGFGALGGLGGGYGGILQAILSGLLFSGDDSGWAGDDWTWTEPDDGDYGYDDNYGYGDADDDHGHSSDEPGHGHSGGSDGEPGMGRVVLAPIESAEIIIAESWPPQYFVWIISVQPDGCHQFDGYSEERMGNEIVIEVYNRLPDEDEEVACTMAVSTTETSVPLGTDFESGETYTITVNDEVVIEFEAQ